MLRKHLHSPVLPASPQFHTWIAICCLSSSILSWSSGCSCRYFSVKKAWKQREEVTQVTQTLLPQAALRGRSFKSNSLPLFLILKPNVAGTKLRNKEPELFIGKREQTPLFYLKKLQFFQWNTWRNSYCIRKVLFSPDPLLTNQSWLE